MGLPQKLRKFLRLNGEPVTEMDYSGLHLRMAYHLKGRDYREDPYDFCYGDKVLRKASKIAALILINSDARKLAVKAIRKAFLDEMRKRRRDEEEPLNFPLTDLEINSIIDRLLEEHAFIREFYYSGVGVYLQNIDARIMEGILTHFTDRSIPVLPLHDSCLIARKYESELREVMCEEYGKIIGFEPVIDRR